MTPVTPLTGMETFLAVAAKYLLRGTMLQSSLWAWEDFIVCRGGDGDGEVGGSIYKSIYIQRAADVRLVSIEGCHLLVEKQIKVDH